LNYQVDLEDQKRVQLGMLELILIFGMFSENHLLNLLGLLKELAKTIQVEHLL